MSRLTPLPALLLVLVAAPLAAQLEPPSTGGSAAFMHEAAMLGHRLRVLVIGAHPDDEDTQLLTVLARGHGAEAAYLSLNRGEGGQNLIGSELGEALGVLRTEELLAARRLDGARQFFTRAYDFGYSRSLDDTWAHWPRDSVLKDVVRTIRRFQPQIVVSIWSGTPRDGHAQHQASGWVAIEAFRVAGDPALFPELESEEGLKPWRPLKLYRETWFDTGATNTTLPGGRLDLATGKTFHQLAMASRSLHRSQDMGRLQQIGPSEVQLALLEDRTGKGSGGFFEGIDRRLVPELSPDDAEELSKLAAVIRASRGAGADSLVDAAERILGRATPSPATRDQLRHLARVRQIVNGVLLDAIADDDHVAAGDTVGVTLMAANGGGDRPGTVELRPDLVLSPGWEPAGGNGSSPGWSLAPYSIDSLRTVVATTPGLSGGTPYYMQLPRVGAMYQWPEWAREWWGQPFEPDPVRGSFRIEGAAAPIEVEASRRANDQGYGEIRTPLVMVPAVGVRLDRDTIFVPANGGSSLDLSVVLTLGARLPEEGHVTIEVPQGWPTVTPQAFRLERSGQSARYDFDVRLPAGVSPGRYQLSAVATTPSGRYASGMHGVAYSHISPRWWERSAVTELVVAPLKLPPLRLVGYVRGAADRVPEALAAAGVPLQVLGAAALARGDLARYDAIVVGPRAYETDSALVRYNNRLLDYARDGGLLLVQYQQYQFVRGGYAPFPLAIAQPHDRITYETAPVELLNPDHPVFTSPNAITADDWSGWVQERGLYFAHSWDSTYAAPLAMTDPGQPAQRGGLLVARLGKGAYVYTGLAFFRQLPAGVPGAFRLFANLLAVPRASIP